MTRPISAGTSMSGPMTPTKASPEFSPKTATATAIASSKLLPAAVKESVADLRVVRAQLSPHPEAHQEHDEEVDDQRDGDAQHVERQPTIRSPLSDEHHQDREEQRDQRERADARNEARPVPLLALEPNENEAGQSCRQRKECRDRCQTLLAIWSDADVHYAALAGQTSWAAP